MAVGVGFRPNGPDERGRSTGRDLRRGSLDETDLIGSPSNLSALCLYRAHPPSSTFLRPILSSSIMVFTAFQHVRQHRELPPP